MWAGLPSRTDVMAYVRGLNITYTLFDIPIPSLRFTCAHRRAAVVFRRCFFPPTTFTHHPLLPQMPPLTYDSDDSESEDERDENELRRTRVIGAFTPPSTARP